MSDNKITLELAVNENPPHPIVSERDRFVEMTAQAHDSGYEQGRLAGLGMAADLLRRCEPLIAGLTRSQRRLKHEATGLHHDIEQFLRAVRR
jgi:hypothetical protein